MRNNLPNLLIIVLMMILGSSKLYATHLLGADLSYECLGPGQYTINLTLYRDCNGVNIGNGATVTFSSVDCGVNGAVNLALQGPAVDITPNCPAVPSACGGAGNFGIEQYNFQGTLNLPPGACDDWILGWSSCCRNNAINTLNNAGGQNMYVGAVLDNTTTPFCNSSPTFNNAPGSIVCVNQPVVYNHGVADADGDSLFFSLGNCMQSSTTQVAYNGGFNAGSPLSTTGGVTINSATGALSFTPNSQQVGVLCVNVREYRNGVLIGQVNRDMQFTVLGCNNVPPQASGVNGAPNVNPVNFETSICANGDLCFTVNGSDPNGNNVTMSWNNEIPGATFVVSNNGTTNPSAQFCWNPGASDVGPNVFTVNVEDDACPVIGQGTYTYIIDVLPSPNTLDAGQIDTICFGESTTLTATSSPAALSYTWSPAASLNTTSGTTVVANPLSNTIYTVEAVFPDGCNLVDQVPVLVTPNPVIAVSPSNAFNCSGQANDLMTVGPNNAGLTFSWAPGGQTTPDITVYPTTTTSYTVTATDNLGCTSTSSTTVTIAAPTGNVCNVLYVTPTGSSVGLGSKADPMDLATALEAGACNGTVVKMAIGDYVTDTAITRVTSYITLEGGFNPAINWDKISTAGATRILRTATQSYSTVSGSIVVGSGIVNETGTNPEIMAMLVSNQTGFRFQDITIETELNSPGTTIATYQGPDVIGVRLNTCNQYNIVRTQIVSDDGGDGADRIWSLAATNGGNSYALDINTNGTGGNLIQTNLQAGNGGAAGVGPPNGTAGLGANMTIAGSALTTNVSTFNLASQPIIRMDDISCTETVMDLYQATSNNWNFGAGSTPATANGSSVSTQYSSLGRKNIIYGTNSYTGFGNIILDAQVLPTFTTSAPFIQGQYRICAGSDVDFTATNGGVGYVYEWDMGGGAVPNTYSGPGYQFLSGVTFNTPGIYTITLNFVTNCCGASIPTTIDLYVEEVPNLVLTPTDADLCYGSGSPINIVADDNIGFGTISWSPAAGLDNASSFVVNALPGDTTTYSATAVDSTGLCSDIALVTINVVNVELTTSVVNTFCGPDGSATVVATGGSGNYAYQWNDPANQTTATATALAVGNYSVLVTDLTTGCSDSANIVVNPGPGALVGFVSSTNPVSCIGNGDGSVTVSVFGGNDPFDYVWSPTGSSTIGTTNTSDSITLLDGGTYSVLITDDDGCTYTVNAFVPEPDSIIIDIDSIVYPTCIGATDGYIEVLVDGGVGPYTIFWDDEDTTQGHSLDSLGIGTYCIYVLDATNCINTMCYTLTAPLLTDSVYDTICQFDSYVLPSGAIVSPLNDTSSIDTLINSIGCDSVVSTYLTVHPVYDLTIDTILCIGQSFQAPNGSIFSPTSDTAFVDSLSSIYGCDSIFGVNITVQNFSITNIDTTVCQGQTITVNGATYNATGIYNDTARYTVTGCDSIQFVIDLRIDSFIIENIDTTICQGQSISVNGVNYTASGLYSDTARYTASGCDSIQFNIDLQIDSFEIQNIDTTVCEGQSITVNGVTYNTTGNFNDTARYTLSGCDSIQFVIDLRVDSVRTETIDTTICQGQSLLVNGITYTIAGSYNDTARYTASGCDSIQFVIDLHIDSFEIQNIDTTVCQGQSITVNGVTYNATGIFNDTISYVASGCDSIQFVIDLRVDSVRTETIDTTICEGQSIMVNGATYNSTGIFNDTARYTASGCDSIQFVIDLRVDSITIENIDTTICQGQSLTVNGVTYTDNGMYMDTARYTASGCDSIQFNIDLHIDSFDITNIDTTICQGQSITVNGATYNATGIFNDTARYTASGCDSIQFVIDLHVDSFSVENIDTTLCQGQTLTVNGTTYTANGLYNDTARYTVSGCDSIQFVIDLHIDSFIVENIDTTICEGQSLTVNGTTYTATGLYIDTARYTASGCDSIQFNIDLQIDSITQVVIDTAICQGDTLFVNGVGYTTAGNYVDSSYHASACIDSIYNLTLSINPLPLVQINASDTVECVNNSITLFGSGTATNTYTWDNTVTDNVPFNPLVGLNDYILTGTDHNGCITRDTIEIEGLPTFNDTVVVTICEDETYTQADGSIINTPGNHTVTVSSISNGCDSTVTTTLNVNYIGVVSPLTDIAVCEISTQTISVQAQNMTSFEWFVNDGSGLQSLVGNAAYVDASTDSITFDLDTSLHQNIYTVQMVDECGNIHTESMTLEVYSTHPVDNPMQDTSVCQHESPTITVDYNGRDYAWSTGVLGSTIAPTESGTYIVNFIENGTNCALSDTIVVSIEDCIANCVLIAPTGFSPNASGNNDIFRVVTTCDEGFSSFQFFVYNRWGELVYSTDDWTQGWAGDYKGKNAEIGTYTYYVEYTKELSTKKEMLKGNVTLIR